MLRLRMTAGCVSKEKLAFIAKAIRAYQVNMVHFTTCESVQFHNLDEKSVCELMEQALDAGIVTMGGGGDFPRNVMCSPLSGVEEGEYFDVMPWAKAAGEYLMTFMEVEPDGTVRQKRTYFDRQNPDIEEAKKFLVKWQEQLVRKLNKEDKILSLKSRDLTEKRNQRFDGKRK